MSRLNSFSFFTRNQNPESDNFGSKNKSMFNIEMHFVKILNKKKELQNVFIQICIFQFIFMAKKKKKKIILFGFAIGIKKN